MNNRELAEAYFKKGWELITQGKYWDAVEQYEKGFTFHEGNSHTWLNLGIVYKDLGEYDKAEVRMRKALKLDPNNGNAWFNLGSMYVRNLHKYKEAINFFDEAIRRNPNDEDAICFKAEALSRNGKNDEAEKFLDKMIKKNPNLEKVKQMQKQAAEFFVKWLEDISKGLK